MTKEVRFIADGKERTKIKEEKEEREMMMRLKNNYIFKHF